MFASPPHIVFLVANLPVPADRRVWQEALALRHEGYAVTVICPRGLGFNSREEQIEGVRVLRFPAPFEARGLWGFFVEYSLTFFWSLVLSLRLGLSRRIDVLHVANPPDFFFLLGWLLRPFRVRFVYDQHDLCPELCAVKFGHGRLARVMSAVMRWMERRSYRLADAVIVTNESAAALARARGGVSAERLFVVPNAPDPAFFHARSLEIAATAHAECPSGEYSCAERQDLCVIGYAGIMGAQDGVSRLIDAVALLVADSKNSAPSFRVELVGEGPERKALEARVRTLGLEKHVCSRGFLSGEEYVSALGGFDVGVIPDPRNGYTDLISMNKTVEYLSLGIPVVLSPLAQSSLEVGDGGLVAEEDSAAGLARAIQRLLDDPVLRRRLGRAGLQKIGADCPYQRGRSSLMQAYRFVLRSSCSG